jgi:two-component system, LuxR family, response regulator FixJ
MQDRQIPELPRSRLDEQDPADCVGLDTDSATRHNLKSRLTAARIRVHSYKSVAELLHSNDSARFGCLVAGRAIMEGGDPDFYKTPAACRIDMPVVQIVEKGNVSQAVSALRLGAADVLEMPVARQALIDCVRGILSRVQHLRNRNGHNSQVAARLSRLSRREHEVLWYVVAGHANKDIARHIGFTRRMADFHRANILRKMQADSVAQLIDMVTTDRNEALWGSSQPGTRP